MQQASDEDYNPFAAPESDLALEQFPESEGQPRYAGFVTRLMAEFVDGVNVRIVIFLFGQIVMFLSGDDGKRLSTAMIIFLVASFVFVWLYYAFQESSSRQATLGKRLLGLRVLNTAGETVSFGQASVRYFGKYLSGILLGVGYLMQPYTERRQALHDILAGTIVVKSR